MHGAACLFPKFLNHLFQGENIEELDISSISNKNYAFKNINSLSSGWTGTCPILQTFSSIQSNYTSDLSYLSSIFSSNHQNTMNAYSKTNNLMEELFTFSKITVTPPSGTSETLTPKFEYEFSDKNNADLIGGKMYNDFTYNLKPYIEKQDGDIKTNVNSFINNNSIQTIINNAYSNIAKFDTTVSTALKVMTNRILELKNYFLNIQTCLMVFTWIYLIIFLAIILFYVLYLCIQNKKLFTVLIILINILFLLILAEIILSFLFGQVRLICHEIPRAIKFIFTDNYISSGNSKSYPAKFGEGDSNMTNLFKTCLNEDGNLANLFINTNNLNDFNSLKNDESTLYTRFNQVIRGSNVVLNNYNSLNNDIFLKAIDRLELMKNNLLYTTEGFEADDIYNILYNIRNNLDSENCGLTNEYYVVKESDCPYGSIKLTTIYTTTGVKHCYIIQNLESGAKASYSGSTCGNNYLNTAITFIKQIDSLLDTRLQKVKNLQTYYSATSESLYNELYSTSEKLNNTYSILISDIGKAKSISNCSSTRYDLINFCDFIGVTTEYDAKIILVFSSFLGVFGFVMIYCFLVILNRFREIEKNDDDDEEFFTYKKKEKYKKKNIKENNSSEDEEEKEDKKKNKNDKNEKKTKKIEMTNMSDNSEDSDEYGD